MSALVDFTDQLQDGWSHSTRMLMTNTETLGTMLTSSSNTSPTSSDHNLTTTTVSLQQSPTFTEGIIFQPLETLHSLQHKSTTEKSPRSLGPDIPGPRTIGSLSSDGESSSPANRVQKRQRNTEAARRYRQRKVDKVTELEDALREMTKERDELRLKLARSEAEADVLRGMVRRPA